MAFPFQCLSKLGLPARGTPRKPRRRRTPLHRFWRPGARAARPNAGRARLAFEPLEPRLLLNADVLAVNLTQAIGAPPIDHSLIVQLVHQTEQVKQQAVTVQVVQVVDQSSGNAVLAFGRLQEISAISIVGGAGNNTLTIDAASFAGHDRDHDRDQAPTISFDGGTGHNNIIFDNTRNTNWTLTGANQGTVRGGGVNLSFQNVGDLTGAANNKDTLTVDPGGSLSGAFDGGAGGSNALVFDNGPHQAASYTVGPKYSTITLDGQSLNFAEVASTNIGDPSSFTLGDGVNAEVLRSGSELQIAAVTPSSFTTMFVQPEANTPFEFKLGAGNTLKVDALDFSQIASGTAFNIDGSGASIEFSGDVSDLSGVSATVHSSGDQSLLLATGAETITATGINAAITVDLGVTISASTISLLANSSTTAAIATDGVSSALTGATITTGNSATIIIDGTLDATGALKVLTGVTLNDTVHATDGANLSAVSITANNTSQVTLGSAAMVIGGSVDIGAATTVTVAVTANDLADNYLNSASTIIPADFTGTWTQIATNITNTTEVTVPATAHIDAGSGIVGGGLSGPSLVLSAADSTNVTSDFTPAQASYMPLIHGVLLFSTVDSSITLHRASEVLVGDMGSAPPTISTPPTLHSLGDTQLTASSGGSIVNNETSDSTLGSAVGSTENIAGSSIAYPGDTTLVELRGVTVNVGGLAASATAATNYLATSHYATNTVYGETNALVDYVSLTAGADGLSLESQDNSTLTAIAQSFDINTQHITGVDKLTITITATSAVNTLDKDATAKLTNSTVNSAGGVTVKAVDNETIVSLADTEAVVITTTPLDKGYFEFGGTFAANSILGQVTASIQSSSVTTSTADSTGTTPGDVQVFAANTSIIDADAQAGSTASGGSIAAGAAGAIAINTIGWTGTTSLSSIGLSQSLDALSAAVNGLLGTSFWTSETPSNVTASITASTVNTAGALLVMAGAQGVINATVSNVSNVTGSAIGGTKTGAAGGVIATNKLSGSAQAFIDNSAAPSATVSAVGAVTVNAVNNDTIASNSTIITSADATTDGAATLATQALNKILNLAGATNYTSGSGTVQLNFGDLVQFAATYDTTRTVFGIPIGGIEAAKNVTLHPGDTVHVSKGYDPELGTLNQTYVYIGSATIGSFNIENANYLDTANWAVATGVTGGIYKFMGADGTSMNLGTGTPVTPVPDSGSAGYTNLDYWYEEPYSQLLPSGYNIKAATGMGVGGIVVTNDVHGGATAYVLSTTLSSDGAITVAAADSATITATIDATATAAGGSVFGGKNSGTVLAINATIATNQVIGSAQAYITDSAVTTTATTDDVANQVSTDVSVTATNSATIAATTKSSITAGGSGGGTAIGFTLAFNAIGDAFNNLLSNTINALLNQTVLGTIAPAVTSAYIHDSSVSSAGALTVSASSTEQISSTIGNDTTSDAMAFANASGTTADGMISSNIIQAGVTAYVDNDNSTGKRPTGATVTSVGAMAVTASDNSSDTASSEETSINTPSNDAGAGLINGYANLVLNSYQFTNQSGTRQLNFGDKVWVGVAVTHTTSSGQSVTARQSVATGDTVQLDSGYDTVTDTVGGTTHTHTTVNPGNVVDDNGTLYRYIGSTALVNVDFAIQATPPHFTDTTNWAQIGGAAGDTYVYTGPANSALDLNNQDYTNANLWTDVTGTGSVYEYMGPGGTTSAGGVTAPGDSVNLDTGNIGADRHGYNNLEYWKPLTQNNIIQGAEIDVALGVIGEVTDNKTIQGNADAYFALIDFNQVQSSTSAYVNTAVVQAASLAVGATDAASISATDSSVVSASTTGGNNGNGEGYGGLIATTAMRRPISKTPPSRRPPGTSRSPPTTHRRFPRWKRRIWPR